MKRDPSLFEPRDARKRVPFAFVLDALGELEITTRPMFGCTALYHGERYLMVLRDKGDADSGVWLGTTHEHHASLHADLPSLRSIGLFGTAESKWRNIPVDGDRFEDEVLSACEMVLRGDPRIGVIPPKKRPKTPKVKATKAPKPKVAKAKR